MRDMEQAKPVSTLWSRGDVETQLVDGPIQLLLRTRGERLFFDEVVMMIYRDLVRKWR